MRAGPGRRDFVWSGTDDAGNALPDGPYTPTVTARGVDGTELHAAVRVVGRIDGIETEDGQSHLLIGEARISLVAVRRLHLANEATNPTPTTTAALADESALDNEGATP